MSQVLREPRFSSVDTRRERLPSVALIVTTIFAYLLALYYGTHTPLDKLPVTIHYDGAYHFAAYFVLGSMVWFGMTVRRPSTLVHCWAAWTIVAAVGLLDEATQPLVGRTFQLRDVAADWMGAAVAIVSMQAYRYVRRRRLIRANRPSRPALIVPRSRRFRERNATAPAATT